MEKEMNGRSDWADSLRMGVMVQEGQALQRPETAGGRCTT